MSEHSRECTAAMTEINAYLNNRGLTIKGAKTFDSSEIGGDDDNDERNKE